MQWLVYVTATILSQQTEFIDSGIKVLKTCVRNTYWSSIHFSLNKAVSYSEIIWVNIKGKEGNITFMVIFLKNIFLKDSKQTWKPLKFKEAQTHNTTSCILFCIKFPLGIHWHLKILCLTHDKEMKQQIYRLFSFKNKLYKFLVPSFYISILKVLES